MKTIFSTILRVTVIVSLMVPSSIFAQSKKGKDKRVEKEQALAGFHSIDVSGLASVYLTSGSTEKASLIVEGMPVDDVVITVKDSVLKVTTKGSHSGETVKVTITYKDLKSIKVSNAAKLYSLNPLKCDKLDISVVDAGAANVVVEVNQLDIEMKEAGDLKVSGMAKHQNVHSNGQKGTLDNSGLRIGKL